MDWLQAVVLGLVQGLTEFLPISSSGHLVLMPHLFGWQDQGLAFDVAVNTGTLVAVLYYFRKEVWALVLGFFRSLRPGGLADNSDGHLAWAVGLATIPVGLFGLLFKETVSTLGRDPVVIAAASILFGLLLWYADRNGRRERGIGGLNWRDAVFIGVGQALALIPGASRSGVTMTAGLLLGFDRETAARFSFLMAIPVGLLAGGLELSEFFQSQPTAREWGVMGVGFLISMVSAFLVIHWLLAWLKSRNMTPFVIYRLLLGGLILILV
ncbi:MAG: undecaprenyl-diphosphate phosphatase [Magnetococcales bacterium]|nr:undecaprenyl-diphosphate phosphatase [Magnetococcales bacterium]